MSNYGDAGAPLTALPYDARARGTRPAVKAVFLIAAILGPVCAMSTFMQSEMTRRQLAAGRRAYVSGNTAVAVAYSGPAPAPLYAVQLGTIASAVVLTLGGVLGLCGWPAGRIVVVVGVSLWALSDLTMLAMVNLPYVQRMAGAGGGTSMRMESMVSFVAGFLRAQVLTVMAYVVLLWDRGD